mmetsp:Transcript_30468/g.76064  ORF Transcript_30468/g.76064 Transcript_30468/m.76064 type:complete len:125 (+) Transcript_30468:512-886(+)|eukprot:CAMPEP_0113258310 /NCGR_PEP_ID=MMETSP0008_2-20120614/15756_1 /TAXON_ID=97485 /ORGANISM="Prymnesium parvum" /LENGTH=124 /DNA_ID=CAMNT_0000106765 /DNA_START=454 /DNA_END=828 /DNA_ORIENTATION=+ /assembly_acc=CAM_ASM_000153
MAGGNVCALRSPTCLPAKEGKVQANNAPWHRSSKLESRIEASALPSARTHMKLIRQPVQSCDLGLLNASNVRLWRLPDFIGQTNEAFDVHPAVFLDRLFITTALVEACIQKSSGENTFKLLYRR